MKKRADLTPKKIDAILQKSLKGALELEKKLTHVFEHRGCPGCLILR